MVNPLDCRYLNCIQLAILLLLFFILVSNSKEVKILSNESKVYEHDLKFRRRDLSEFQHHNNLRFMHNMTDVELFHSIASKYKTDKVTTHKYAEIYGSFLIPFLRRRQLLKEKTKFLEIGLGNK